MSNQKQLALGFIMWQGDNTNQFPWQVSSTNGGSMEDAARGYAAANFRALDAYIKSPYVFVCPTDKAKTKPANVATMRNANVSYFVGLDTNAPPNACVLTGDCDLQAGQSPVLPGLFVHTNGLAMGWTGELHSEHSNVRRGVMSFYDGHAELVVDARMDSVFNQAGLAASRFDVP